MPTKIRIRKGDQVEVISGKDIGARGRVIAVLPRKNRVLVEGVNMVTRHEKISISRQGKRIDAAGAVGAVAVVKQIIHRHHDRHAGDCAKRADDAIDVGWIGDDFGILPGRLVGILALDRR